MHTLHLPGVRYSSLLLAIITFAIHPPMHLESPVTFIERTTSFIPGTVPMLILSTADIARAGIYAMVTAYDGLSCLNHTGLQSLSATHCEELEACIALSLSLSTWLWLRRVGALRPVTRRQTALAFEQSWVTAAVSTVLSQNGGWRPKRRPSQNHEQIYIGSDSQ
ncbi:hypothetical protein PYCCODRAFT_1432779 [Trametes coccinea BRFM310]|uniref:Uncharacterized protein n=1 Tax=Trametes coccinea (strain BRFM310) TaxID=1353009 RepID=A0A1Y2IYI7_TRAC3|nr:hypothetical protein PYCCODRAFT_1432779 [Trametes coccinea BRFM310]